MPAKGQRKPPAMSLREAHDHAMAAINDCQDRIALFFVAGRVSGTKNTSEQFERNIKRLAAGLIGVYDQWADARDVLEDLRTFYREPA